MLTHLATQLYNYVYGQLDEAKHLILTHQMFEDNYKQIIHKVLDQYGLEAHLKQARQNGGKLLFLDAGCGAGLFLHEIVAILKERQLLEAADLNGLDINKASLATAETLSQPLNSLHPLLNFYWHDLSWPLDSNEDLKLEKKLHFDFISATLVMGYLPDARPKIAHLYEKLAPGGVIYLYDPVFEEGPAGWSIPLPTATAFVRAVAHFIKEQNHGRCVSLLAGEWLREAGAELVEVTPLTIGGSGESKEGMQVLRYFTTIVINGGLGLVAHKVISQEEYEQAVQSFFQEVNQGSVAQLNFVNTLARKPF